MKNMAKTDVANQFCGCESKYRLSVDELYEVAYKFYLEMREKAFHLTYKVRQELSALACQAKYGRFNSSLFQQPGILDIVGHDRKSFWEALGDMSTDEAKRMFVNRLYLLCPMLLPYLEAYARSHESPEDNNVQGKAPTEAPERLQNNVPHAGHFDEAEVRQALNEQTREQFTVYARQQFPYDVEKQAELISQLQNRHFHEYMSYLRHEMSASSSSTPVASCMTGTNGCPTTSQSVDQPVERTTVSPMQTSASTATVENVCALPSGVLSVSPAFAVSRSAPARDGSPQQLPSASPVEGKQATDYKEEEELADGDVEVSSAPLVQPPTMWTNIDIREFKNELLDEDDAITQVGCGEVITIRVPAYPSGSSIVWEFATDDYDIAFGLFFEWPLEHSTPSQGEGSTATPEATPVVDEIVPVYKRNCHLEAYCGSHVYPGPGTYLFKFDNTYSLWRSKTLYYRVFYTS